MQETWVSSLSQEYPVEKGMAIHGYPLAIHSSILSWRIPWTEEPGGLRSMELQRAGLNWATNTLTVLFKASQVALVVPADSGDTCLMPESGGSSQIENGNPPQYSCLENLMDRGA